jgi:ABC-2 type transport system permease protein/sodium transport system permease protein
VPGVLCLIPTLEFKDWMAVTPLVNIVMLARDMLEGDVDNGLAAVAVFSTLFYVAAAIALASRIFGTDAILYGSPATWSDLVRRPQDPQTAASLPAVMLGLALMFPCYFVMANSLALWRDLPMDRRLVISGLITAVVFGGIPGLIAFFGRVSYSSGLGWRRPSVLQLLAAALLGLVLWPAAHEIYLLSNWLGLSILGSEQIAAAQSMIGQFQAVPLWLLLITLAVAPAVFEELCFRGFLFSSLRTRIADDWTVIASAFLFGLFHEILIPGRFLPSTFLGLVLGWVRLRTASVIPGMVLHALHNGLLLSIVYYRHELAARGWGVEEQQHLPAEWHAAAAFGIVLAIVVLMVSTRASRAQETALRESAARSEGVP